MKHRHSPHIRQLKVEVTMPDGYNFQLHCSRNWAVEIAQDIKYNAFASRFRVRLREQTLTPRGTALLRVLPVCWVMCVRRDRCCHCSRAVGLQQNWRGCNCLTCQDLQSINLRTQSLYDWWTCSNYSLTKSVVSERITWILSRTG